MGNAVRSGQRARGPVLFMGLLVAALAYGLVRREVPALTGSARVDGTIGVVLGLYLCSNPAANAVDALFYGRRRLERVTAGGLAELALNLAVLAAGWSIVFDGAIRLVR